MKKVLMIACAAGLASCTPLGGVLNNAGTVISNAADATTLDEQVGIDATTAYTAASLLGARLVSAGVIDKVKFKSADNKGYAAVLAIRAAYEAGNSKNYIIAIRNAYSSVDDIKALVK